MHNAHAYVVSIPLRKPSQRNHRQLLAQRAKMLRPIRHHHDCLLYCGSGHVRGAIEELAGRDLPRTRDSE